MYVGFVISLVYFSYWVAPSWGA